MLLWAIPLNQFSTPLTPLTHATGADYAFSLGILFSFGLLVPNLAIGKVSL